MVTLRRLLRPVLTGAAAIALAAAALAVVPDAGAATGDGSPTDANVRYFGRWDAPGPTTVGHWSAPYIRTAFTGRTIKIKLRDSANIYVSIDGRPDVFHVGVRGTVNLTPTPLAEGTHQVWVAFRGGAAFQGFELDPGAQTVAPRVSDRLVEYVGDSITFGATSTKLTVTSYGHFTSEKLGVERATVARSGGCLVNRADCFGLSTNYFTRGVGLTDNWDFAQYRADAVVINMGTNDAGRGVTAADFQATYLDFLRAIRAKRPNAALFVFQNFRQRYVAEHQAAVRTLNDAGDRNVFYVPTAGWTAPADFTDGGHPNDAGARRIADRLAPIIAPHLDAAIPPPPANGYVKLVNRRTGKVIGVAGNTTAAAPVVQQTDTGSPFQQWQRLDAGAGAVKLVNRGSGLVLDVTGKSLLDGAAAGQYRDTGGTNQHWLTETSGGFTTLRNRLSGKVLDLFAGGSADGTAVVQWTGNGGTNQQWTLPAA